MVTLKISYQMFPFLSMLLLLRTFAGFTGKSGDRAPPWPSRRKIKSSKCRRYVFEVPELPNVGIPPLLLLLSTLPRGLLVNQGGVAVLAYVISTLLAQGKAANWVS